MNNVPPTTEELATWTALCEAAAPEPWAVGPGHSLDGDCAVWDANHIGNGDYRIACWILKPETADFIAAARSALPRLITEVARLHAVRDEPEWVFSFLAAKLELWAEMHTGGPAEARDCLAALSAVQGELTSLRTDLASVESQLKGRENANA